MAKLADLDRRWHVVDATDLVLGRMATKLARVLMGKHKPTYTPHLDGGDFVIVVNSAKVKLTGRKRELKTYEWCTRSQSGQSSMPGGYRTRTVGEQLAKDASKVIRLAVQRMMPKTKLGRNQMTKLKCYSGGEHPHAAQKPEKLDFTKI